MKIIILTIFLLITFDHQKKALFIGDSLSTYKGGWQDVVSKEKSYTSTNTSIGGKRTDWMLNVLGNKLSGKDHYEVVFIYGGINDIFSNYKAEIPLNNIRLMVMISKAKKITPIIITGYDSKIITNTWVKDRALETKFRLEYKRFQDSLMVMKGVKIIPPVPLLRTDSDDGIHLNASGHKKFSTWILKHI